MEKQEHEQMRITDQLKEYTTTRLKLAKLQAIEKGTAIAADIIVDLVLLFCFLLVFLFASITLAFFLAGVLGSNWAGFGSVAIFYLFAAATIIVFKSRFERPVINVLISKLLK